MSLKIRLSLATTQAVIIATAVLHNICRQNNIEDVEPEINIPFYEPVSMLVNEPTDNSIVEREDLINNYFGRFVVYTYL